MAVGADQHGMIAGRSAVGDPPPDLGGDPVGLLGSRREGLEPDRCGIRGLSPVPVPVVPRPDTSVSSKSYSVLQRSQVTFMGHEVSERPQYLRRPLRTPDLWA